MSKKIILTSLVLALTASLYYFNFFQQKLNPISSKNQFYSKLNHAIHTAKLDITDLQIRDFQKEVEFKISQSHIILSSQKDPYLQIASLQQFFKTAKIKGKTVVSIDLSTNHPYATFKHR